MAKEEDQAIAMKQQYPLDPKCYKCIAEIGKGVGSIVYKATCIPIDSSLVAIKIINLSQTADLENVQRKAQIATQIDHPNLLRPHCCFIVNATLWVVMPYMPAGSLKSIVACSFPDGLPEACIAAVLKQILTGIFHLHRKGRMHRDIKSSNILIDSDGTVKLADFNVSASLTSASLPVSVNDSTGPPYWVAPEVIQSPDPYKRYGFSAEMWSFGITALELAHGKPPLSNLPPSQLLTSNITDSFKDMVGFCLQRFPTKRPMSYKILKHPFFKNCYGPDFLMDTVLKGLPAVERRFTPPKILRHRNGKKGDDEVVAFSTTGGDISMISRGRITGWKFNEDWFEMEPIYQGEDDDNKEVKVHLAESSSDITTGGGGGGAAATTPMVFLRDSLDDHMQKLGKVLESFNAMSVEETRKQEQMMPMQEILNLKKEVGNLKKEVESLKKQVFKDKSLIRPRSSSFLTKYEAWLT